MVSGGSYNGMWENNMRSGYGIAVNPAGEIFEGHFIRDLKEGKGKMTFTDGTI